MSFLIAAPELVAAAAADLAPTAPEAIVCQ
jgi:hypothetical protein